MCIYTYIYICVCVWDVRKKSEYSAREKSTGKSCPAVITNKTQVRIAQGRKKERKEDAKEEGKREGRREGSRVVMFPLDSIIFNMFHHLTSPSMGACRFHDCESHFMIIISTFIGSIISHHHCHELLTLFITVLRLQHQHLDLYHVSFVVMLVCISFTMCHPFVGGRSSCF